jgi:uncharacterized caspase-like protein
VPDLLFASNDAKRFEAGMKKYIAPSYTSYTSKTIAGAQTPQDDLLAAIKRLAETNMVGDTLVLFFASHGVSDQHGFSILLPGRVGSGDVGMLPFSAISDALRPSQGRVFVFLDVCHSADATQDLASEQLASTARDITIITASKGLQSSLENVSWGGCIFTTAVLATLGEDRHGRTQNGLSSLTIEDLYANVRKKVMSQTNGRQTPWLRRSEWRGMQSIN